MRSILIIKLGAIGDVLRTTSILPGLLEKYQHASIDWITSNSARDLLISNPLINRIHVISPQILEVLGRYTYDLLINLDEDQFACELASALTARYIVGAYSHNGSRTYTSDSAIWFDMSLISVLGKKTADELKRSNKLSVPEILSHILGISKHAPALHIGPEEKNLAENFSSQHSLYGQPVVGLNTGAGPRWRYKRLSEKKTAALADGISISLNAKVLLYGGVGERRRNDRIITLALQSVIDTGHNNNLAQFVALISLCNVLITSDSLAMHIASALNINVVAFFGPTSYSEVDLFGRGEKIIPKRDCLVCYKSNCSYVPTCMDNIHVSEIIDKNSETTRNENHLIISILLIT